MRDLKSKLAREVNRLTGWRGMVFERRYAELYGGSVTLETSPLGGTHARVQLPRL